MIDYSQYEFSENSISFNSRIANWPSSTCAELGAIQTALLAVFSEMKIRIYSNSKVAKEGIQGFKDQISIRNIFKVKNYSLINQIIDCCKTKSINLELIKVKGYSMNYWNNKADKLVKEGLLSDLTLEAQNIITNRIRVLPI